MTTATTTAPRARTAGALSTLYTVRSAFAIVWAVVLFATGSSLGAVSGTLLVLYPAVDLAAAVVDLRTSGRPTPALYVNSAVSLGAAIGLGVAATSGVPAVLRVWGVWAITAGVVQLIVAVTRYRLGGQWPMILSGAISVLAGASFVTSASADDPSVRNIAGYAVLGGVFFLASALRLRRSAGAA